MIAVRIVCHPSPADLRPVIHIHVRAVTVLDAQLYQTLTAQLGVAQISSTRSRAPVVFAACAARDARPALSSRTWPVRSAVRRHSDASFAERAGSRHSIPRTCASLRCSTNAYLAQRSLRPGRCARDGRGQGCRCVLLSSQASLTPRSSVRGWTLGWRLTGPDSYLNLTASATTADISRAYRRRSLELQYVVLSSDLC